MLKETEERIGFIVAFLSLVAFQMGGGPPGPPLATLMIIKKLNKTLTYNKLAMFSAIVDLLFLKLKLGVFLQSWLAGSLRTQSSLHVNHNSGIWKRDSTLLQFLRRRV